MPSRKVPFSSCLQSRCSVRDWVFFCLPFNLMKEPILYNPLGTFSILLILLAPLPSFRERAYIKNAQRGRTEWKPGLAGLQECKNRSPQYSRLLFDCRPVIEEALFLISHHFFRLHNFIHFFFAHIPQFEGSLLQCRIFLIGQFGNFRCFFIADIRI